MRLDTHTARIFVVNQLEKARIVKDIRFEDEDCVFVDLTNGESVNIHLYGRHLPMPELFDIFAVDNRMNAHTLPLLLCHWLIPEHGDTYEPPEWIDSLHTIFSNRIYTYEVDGPDTFIYPVNFERQRKSPERIVRYGPAIKNLNLSCSTVNLNQIPLTGAWKIADFQEQAFQHETPNPEPEPMQTYNAVLLPYYRILDVDITANFDDIKKKYRELARLYHPDLNKSRHATELMQSINEAYRKIAAHFGG